MGSTHLKVEDGDPIQLETHDEDNFFGIRGRSEKMRRLMAEVKRAALSDVSILELGETGVGKEVVASAIHRASPRANKPFETVDCGSLAPNLIASELFGHEKGAFTGAESRHIGAFERAHGGTVFLDEIGELPRTLQTTFLGVLERRSFRRVGGSQPIEVDVRLVSATHRDLRAEVNAGTFREDLYYRTAVLRLHIPPLRERADDLSVLMEHFAADAGYEGHLDELVPAQAMKRLQSYRWPGNVRELRNFMDAAIAMGAPPALDTGDIGHVDSDSESFPSVPLSKLLHLQYKDARGLLLHEFEELYLTALLETAEGNVSKAARIAKINRTHLFEMLKRHRLR